MTQTTSAPALNAGQRLTLACGQMVHGGLCVAHTADGATVLVDGAIPGETAEVELRFRKRHTWFGTVVDATAPSAARIRPPCRYVPECGGCQLQHVQYAQQLSMKRAIVVDALQRQGVQAPAISVTGMDDPWHYRWRGEFHVVPGEHGISDAGLGFNRVRSWRAIAVDDCLIHHHAIVEALTMLRDIVRRGGDENLRTLHVTVGDGGSELLLRAKPRQALNPAAIDAAAQGTNAPRLATDSTTVTWRGHSYRISPDAFMQVNWANVEALYAAAIAGLGAYAGKRVIDAYAGIGVLAAELAAEAREVLCIESNRAAARMGVLNARVNDVADRVTYSADPVEDVLPELGVAGDDCLLLDPPRAGCDSRVTAWLALAGPQRVVYVSCDPATLARDLHLLVASGPYVIDRLDVIDMFPQTFHTESVVTLTRA